MKRTKNPEQEIFQGPGMIIVWENLPGRPVKFVSENTKNILGYSPEELLNNKMHFDKFIHPVDLPMVKRKVSSYHYQRIDAYELHYRLKGKNGEFNWFYEYSIVKRDENGDIKEIHGCLIDQTMISQKRSLHHSQREDHEFLFEDLFMTHNSVMLLMELETGRIVKANLAAQKFYGYSVDQLESMKIQEINTASEEEVYKERKKVAEENRMHFEFKHRLKDGSIKDVEVFSSSIPIQGQYFLFSIIHDVTEKKKAERDLVDAKVEAELANQAKSIFLANMSHEVRTPLHGIHGFSELLKTTTMTEQQLKYLTQIEGSGKRLNKIIDDILDISKIESEKTELDLIPFSIDEVVESTMELMRPMANKKELDFIYEIADGLSDIFYGDPSRLGQILSNLLSNAIKFTDSGYVKLTVDESVVGDQNIVRFAIEDTGIGIRTEDLSLLFQPFSQIDNRFSRGYGGVGLGLKISKSLAEMMGGSIQVRSAFGIGSTFTISVPMKSGYETRIKDTEKDKDLKKTKINKYYDLKLKALVVDDQDMAREVIMEILDKRNFHCDGVSNGKEALEAIKNEVYDAVFMDCQMPVMDGYDATRKIREEQAIIQPVIIALTAQAMKGDKEKCLSAGMDEYLTKPVDLGDLDRILDKIRKTAHFERREERE